MTQQAWPHPYAEVTRAETTVTAALLPGIGEGLRDVARVLSIARRLENCDCAALAAASDVAIDPTHGRIVVTTKGCPGQSADRLRAAETIPIARVVRIVASVIDALRAAHGIGVLHRALSLASVVIDGDDVRVVDFGLGDLLAPDSPHATLRLLALTPERIMGLPPAATEDIYLLGCVAYHLVSGDPPFVDVDDDVAPLRRRHAIEDPPRLSRTGPAGVPSVLGRVIERCLEKESDDRYPDMDALAQAWAKAAAEAGLDLTRAPAPKPKAVVQPAPRPAPRPGPPPSTPSVARTSTGPRAVVPTPPPPRSVVVTSPASIATPPSAESSIDAAPVPVETAPPVVDTAKIEPPAIVSAPTPEAASIDEPVAAAAIAAGPRATPIMIPPAPRPRRGALAAAAAVAAVVAIAFLAMRGGSTATDDRSARAPEPSSAPAAAMPDSPSQPTIVAAAPDPVEEAPPPALPEDPIADPATPSVVAVAPSPPLEGEAEDPVVEVGTAPTVVAADGRAADLVRRANEARRAGNTNEGIGLYKQALASEPKNVEALSALARIYFDRGSFSDAVNWGKRLVDAAPTSAKARLALGDAYFKLGKLAQAETQYRKADKLGHRLADSRLAAVRTSP